MELVCRSNDFSSETDRSVSAMIFVSSMCMMVVSMNDVRCTITRQLEEFGFWKFVWRLRLTNPPEKCIFEKLRNSK